MNWKLHSVCLLCVGLMSPEGRAAPVSLIETVHYEYTFQAASGAVIIEAIRDDGRILGYSAREEPGDGGFGPPEFILAFSHDGSQVVDLEGTSLTYTESASAVDFGLIPSPSVEIEGIFFWLNEGFGDGTAHSANLVFGENNEIISWTIRATHPSSDYMSHWSEPEFRDEYLGIDLTEKPIFGEQGFGAPDAVILWTNRGRWQQSVERFCSVADGGASVDCPETPAAIPLPPSLMLLASALVGVASLRRRRKAASEFRS